SDADTAAIFCCFFFHATATTDIYTLSLHDALPISTIAPRTGNRMAEFRIDNSTAKTKLVTPSLDLTAVANPILTFYYANVNWLRSEEHTSELQSRENLVCRLLLEKKKS